MNPPATPPAPAAPGAPGAAPPLRVLASEPVALPPHWLAGTTIEPPTPARPWERWLQRRGHAAWARRSQSLRRAWALFRHSRGQQAVVSLGDLEGLALAALQRCCRRRPVVHIMYDCLWYGGGRLRCAGMRFCLGAVSACVVWASVECQRYARAYGVPEAKFVFVPHHHTLGHYSYTVADNGYLFTGGNADRDFAPLFEALRTLPYPCKLATNRPHLLAGLAPPPNVEVVSLTPAGFRECMARARLVVMPMRASLLHAGAQQSILNAMLMGKPVILTDPEGGRDYINTDERERTGFLVPYGQPQALAQALARVWEDPALARQVGARAHRAAAALSTETCNRRIWELAAARVRAAG